jgi:hypothetical protein
MKRSRAPFCSLPGDRLQSEINLIERVASDREQRTQANDLAGDISQNAVSGQLTDWWWKIAGYGLKIWTNDCDDDPF